MPLCPCPCPDVLLKYGRLRHLPLGALAAISSHAPFVRRPARLKLLEFQELTVRLSPQVVSLADYDHVQEVTKEGSKKLPSPGYPLVCVTPCDPHYPKYSVMKERCEEAGINQTQVHFSWEVASPTDTNGARSPFETVTDTTPYTSVNHMVSGERRPCRLWSISVS